MSLIFTTIGFNAGHIVACGKPGRSRIPPLRSVTDNSEEEETEMIQQRSSIQWPPQIHPPWICKGKEKRQAGETMR